MIFDGRKEAEKIKVELKGKFSKFEKASTLAVVYVGSNAVIERFIAIKKRFADYIGVPFEVKQFNEDAGEGEIISCILKLNRDEKVGGIIIQLPLPEKFEKEKILDALVGEKDIDALSSGSNFLAPVAGSVKKILEVSGVDPKGKVALVVGKGQLVGLPTAEWLKKGGAHVSVVEEGDDVASFSKNADIIVSGAGVPGLITPSMIKEGCVLIDAGTSESAGKLSGDADPACAEKCKVFTPVPGGVGPLTVACLFQNLYEASRFGEFVG